LGLREVQFHRLPEAHKARAVFCQPPIHLSSSSLAGAD
jgi:hypothetical protein